MITKILHASCITRIKQMIFVCLMTVLLFSNSNLKASPHQFMIAPDTVPVFTNTDFIARMVIDASGIAPGGTITLQFPANWGWPQDNDSMAANYVKVRCSNPSVKFTTHAYFDFMYPLIGIYTNEIHYGIFKDSVGTLGLGDTVYFYYGNHVHGGYGFTPSRIAAKEHIYFATKHDSLAAQSAIDSISILQTPLDVYRITALAKSNPTINSPFKLLVVAYDKLNNPALAYNRTIYFSNQTGTISGLPTSYTFSAVDSGIHSFDITITDYDVHRIKITDGLGMTCLSNPLEVDTTGLKTYWGDMHTHSQLSHHGLGTPYQVFDYGKNVSYLDYLSFTEHSYIPDSQYRAGINTGNQFNVDGSFVTLNGYEWSTAAFGHKCVYFNSANPPAIITNYNNPDYLLSTVFQQGGLVHVTHSTGLWGAPATYNTDWTYFDPAVQTNAEVTGNSGICFELENPQYAQTRTIIPGTTVQDGLARHYIFGLIGASDNHQGRPGKNPNPEFNAFFTYVYPNLTSKDVGISASLAPSLTRNNIFQSLKTRHNYATTGARILIDYRLDDHLMGDYFAWDSAAAFPTLSATIHGTDTISRIDIVKNNNNIVSYTPNSLDYSFSYIDSAATFNSYYYLRIFQTNTDMAWTSPIWLLDSSTFTTNQMYLKDKFDVEIFPNPNDGNFQVRFFNNFSKTCLISVTDVTGKKVYNSQETLLPFSNATISLSIPGLPSGVYLLDVNCDNNLIHKKIFIEHRK